MSKLSLTAGVIAILIVSAVFLFIGHRTNPDQPPAESSAAKLVSPQEFSELAENPKAFILDVHTPEQTHIPGTDAFIPYDQINSNTDKLPQDKSTLVLVYCRSGNMSAEAARDLISLGYTKVYDLAGGTNAYRESHVTVSLDPNNIALGKVVYGEVAHAKFTLTNWSPLALKITRVSTSCGCTTVTVKNTELDGYAATTLDLAFNPAFHKDDTDLGDITRTVYIETDNPNFPRLQSSITATVIKK